MTTGKSGCNQISKLEDKLACTIRFLTINHHLPIQEPITSRHISAHNSPPQCRRCPLRRARRGKRLRPLLAGPQRKLAGPPPPAQCLASPSTLWCSREFANSFLAVPLPTPSPSPSLGPLGLPPHLQGSLLLPPWTRISAHPPLPTLSLSLQWKTRSTTTKQSRPITNCSTGCAILLSTRSNMAASSTSCQLQQQASGTLRVLGRSVSLPHTPQWLPRQRHLSPDSPKRQLPPPPPNISRMPLLATSV